MKLTRKQYIMLGVLIIGSFVTMLNQTVVNPAMPSVMKEMGVDAATVQWLSTGFMLVNAIMIPITAYLTDNFTTRRLFLVSMTIFTLGTLFAAASPVFEMLLAGRLVQAMGAGMLMPLVMTVIMITFPIERRGFAMGIMGVVMSFAPAIGPTLAGVLIDALNYHYMFYIICGLGAAITVVGALTLTSERARSKATDTGANFDAPTVIYSCLGFGGLLYGFSDIGSNGVTLTNMSLLAMGVLALILFVRRQLASEHPMLEVRVLKNRRFLVGTIISMVVQVSLLSASILIPIYIQTLRGLPAVVSGLVLMPGALVSAVLGPISGRWFDKRGPRGLSMIGLAMLTIATLSFVGLGLSWPVWLVVCVYAVRMIALTLVNMPISTWAMNALDVRYVAHGSAVNNTLRMMAGSLGTALIVSITTSISNACAAEMGAAGAYMLGIDVAFGISAALCLAAFVLTVLFVKNKPQDEAQVDPTGEKRSLIEGLMKREVYSLRSDATVEQAMMLFVEEGISAAPIVDDQDRPVGFISDGDLMRALSSRNREFIDPVVMIMRTAVGSRDFDSKLDMVMKMNVMDIGVKKSIGVEVTASLPEVCRVLGENHLKKVPVMDNGRIVGMINRSDITQYSMRAYLKNRGMLL